MLDVLRNTTYRHLFFAQVIALLGTGLATVALGLLAFDLAGAEAGAVLGTALAIKMAAYIGVAPIASAFAERLPRRAVLVALDLIRAGVALTLPFITQIWQIYVLIALLQSASAGFTPLFQSLIPEVLEDERDYTRALSLSRMAYDLESLFSPALAAALLTLVSFHGLFAGTAAGFVVSALLVLGTAFPASSPSTNAAAPFEKARRGMRIYLRTPRLRGLLALNLCAASGGAMVFVNTVVIVREVLGGGEAQVAYALAAFGGGSMLMALLLPRLLERWSERRFMLLAAIGMVTALLATTILWWWRDGFSTWTPILLAWAALGICYAGLVTPGGRLLRRSARAEDLPFLFAAQFSLSHLCWLLAYPLAGWLGATLGLGVALAALSALALVACALAFLLWRGDARGALAHRHDDLPDDHPHLREYEADQAHAHSHEFFIDANHPRWPKAGQ